MRNVSDYYFLTIEIDDIRNNLKNTYTYSINIQRTNNK